METKNLFKEYLFSIEEKKKQVCYNYSIAIGRLSKHYSKEKNNRFDFYDEMPENIFNEIVKLYSRGGQFQDEGDYSRGTNRAALNALGRFKKYVQEKGVENLIANIGIDSKQDEIIEEYEDSVDELSKSFSYEKDLKRIVIEQVEALFPGYEIFEGIESGVEYTIKNKRIDLLLNNINGDFLIVELKSGKAKFDVFGQVSMYMGLLNEKFPTSKIEACIIANEIDKSLEYAAKTNPAVKLKTYVMQLSITDY